MGNHQRLAACCVSVLLAAAVSVPAVSAESGVERKITFTIAEQPLASALTAFARQAQVQILQRDEQVSTAGKLAPALNAESLSPQQALEKLLSNSGLKYEFINERTVRIIVDETTPLQTTGKVGEQRGAAVRIAQAGVAATANASELEEVIVKGTTIDDPILSSRTGDTLRDRPQSISIVTRQRLDEQNIDSLGSALEQATGVTVVKESNASQLFFSRGFEINSVQVDGGAALVINAGGYDQTIDLALYEQVEVLRGADALFSGNGKPGGSVQLVRKRPTATPQVSVEVAAGRWGNYRGQVDVSGPMAWDGRLRGRAVYMSESSQSFQKSLLRGDRDLFYVALDVDVTDSTRVSLGGSYSKSESPLGSFGLPRYSDGRDLRLPRSASLTADWSRAETDAGEAFARVEQRISDAWSLRVNAMRSSKDSDYLFYYQYAAIDPIAPIGTLYPENGQRHAVQEVVDMTLTGSVDWWGRTHKVAIGADWQDAETTGPGWNAPEFMFDPFAFDPAAYPMPERSAVPASTRTFGNKQNGVYASLSLQVTQPMRILGGARYSNYKYSADYPTFDYALSYEDRDVVTPYLGFTYELPAGWVAYGSFAETFESQASSLSGPFPGAPLDPMTGRNLELGIKGGLGAGRAVTQFAVYQIERDNQAVLDSSFPPQSGDLGAVCCYRAQGVVQSRGLDAEISGKLSPSWDLFVGYTYNENEYKSGYDSNLGALFMPQTPRHLLKIWSGYRFSGAWSRLKVSGGVSAQSRSFVRGVAAVFEPGSGAPLGSVPYEFSQSGYAILSARGEYAFNETWSAALNFSNLLDKTYYQTVGDTGAGNWYGQPRSFTLTLRGRW
ncbi:TonB-dependent siderophore receptor [Steroidobacter sp.]|uniref:TonB-dependent siderophore receptor n=1 Tax=Steroidobacter sp. TaxID=1978227 RepID=UPI001A61C8CC|nr:TonB-dependent receptor [Steroidobacter sp.]MBL8269047.1 TonB-dependent siderophore receptor [Steroidobacter sp.]